MAVWSREDPIRNFPLKKTIIYPDSAKVDVVKIIFHALFLVLETSKRRKEKIEQSTYTFHKFI